MNEPTAAEWRETHDLLDRARAALSAPVEWPGPRMPPEPWDSAPKIAQACRSMRFGSALMQKEYDNALAAIAEIGKYMAEIYEAPYA